MKGRRLSVLSTITSTGRSFPPWPTRLPTFTPNIARNTPPRETKTTCWQTSKVGGHYVGTVLNVRQREGGWFGEGDDFFYIDGEQEPSLRGTGTEDYFCDAWGFREFSGPFYGVPIFDHYRAGGLITAYRWHIADPVSFTSALRVEIEHKGAAFDENGSVRSGYEPRADDFASVAYWYQIEPHKPFPPLPAARDRLYRDFKQVVQGETLLDEAAPSEGPVSRQDGEGWSGGAQLFWCPTKAGQSLNVPFAVEKGGVYDIALVLTHSWDYGIYAVIVNGETLPSPLDLYSADIEVKKHLFREVNLEAGEQTLELRNVGKSEESGGYFLGLDAIIASPVE